MLKGFEQKSRSAGSQFIVQCCIWERLWCRCNQSSIHLVFVYRNGVNMICVPVVFFLHIQMPSALVWMDALLQRGCRSELCKCDALKSFRNSLEMWKQTNSLVKCWRNFWINCGKNVWHLLELFCLFLVSVIHHFPSPQMLSLRLMTKGGWCGHPSSRGRKDCCPLQTQEVWMSLGNHSLTARFSALGIFAMVPVLPRPVAWLSLGHGRGS